MTSSSSSSSSSSTRIQEEEKEDPAPPLPDHALAVIAPASVSNMNSIAAKEEGKGECAATTGRSRMEDSKDHQEREIKYDKDSSLVATPTPHQQQCPPPPRTDPCHQPQAQPEPQTFPFSQTQAFPVEQLHGPAPHRQSRSESRQQPGAYTAGGISGHRPNRLAPSSASSVSGGAWLSVTGDSASAVTRTSTSMDRANTNPNTNANANDYNLVEARAVPNEEQMMVTIVAECENDSQKRSRRNRNRTVLSPTQAVLLLVIVILAGTGLLLLILWASGARFGSNSHINEIAPTAGPSVPPGNATLLSYDYLKQKLPNKTHTSIFIVAIEDSDSASGIANVSDFDENEQLVAPTVSFAASPQSSAFQWLSQDPLLRNYTEHRIRQRFAMATLFYATQGPYWKYNERWLSYDHHECDWYVGQTANILGKKKTTDSACRDLTPLLVAAAETEATNSSNATTTSTAALQEDDGGPDNQSIRRLWFRNNTLNGTLPDELYWLTNLEEIDMSTNSIQGHLSPTGLTKLSYLKGLSFPHNFLSGVLPTELGLMTQLTNIYFGNSGTALNGPIPSEIGMLTNLKMLTVSRGGFTGTLATQLGALANLTVLAIQGTNVTGPLPSELGRLTEVIYSAFFSNQFSGTIPTELAHLSKLAWLRMHNNNLSGPLPSELGQLVSLQEMTLDSNALTSTIPTELGRLPRVYTIDLSNNMITGLLPSEIGLMPKIKTWNVAGNSLTGLIPKAISNWTDLALFNVSGNTGLSGTVPETLCNISTLAFTCDNVTMATKGLCGCLQCLCALT